MRIKMIISRLLFAMTICFFSYSCGGEESSTTQAPVDKRTTKAPAKIPWPERPGKAAADKERAKKIQELIEKLDGDDAREAYDAVLKLSMFGDETAVEPLMDIAERESGMMRTAALQALGSIGDKRAFNLILDALNDAKKKDRGQVLKLEVMQDSRPDPVTFYKIQDLTPLPFIGDVISQVDLFSLNQPSAIRFKQGGESSCQQYSSMVLSWIKTKVGI